MIVLNIPKFRDDNRAEDHYADFYPLGTVVDTKTIHRTYNSSTKIWTEYFRGQSLDHWTGKCSSEFYYKYTVLHRFYHED